MFAGSRVGSRGDYALLAEALGAELGRRGYGLVYGGGHIGLMGVLADSALEHGARVLGVIPQALADRELAHQGLHELAVVGTMHERKALMAARSSAFIALPGGYGTLEELSEVLTWVQLGIHQKPIGLLGAAGFWQPYLALLDHFASEGFVDADERKLLLHAEQPAALLDALERHSAARPRLASEGDL